ncbi:hypothetical protein FOL47_004959 [Perkinsus chesapeaki]|uniref:Uncharacterized protein n=1 Tax=Perkinsus chesapeaki TaxID=330153 RepID=A0A7J6MYS9_PERCH|nr:hypothetical protein FOL47_004959 [Perkinsus chesapeaki]
MSSSSSSGTTNGGRTSGTTGSAADRSASAPPFSGITVAGDNSEFSERASTLEHSFVHRQVRSVSTLERDSGHIAGGGFETSSPGGRRPWHRRAREMLAEAAARAAEAAVASEREKLQQRGSPPATSAAAVTAAALEQKLREQPVRGLRPVRPAPEVSSSSSTQREAAAAPFIKAGASASSTSKQPPSRSGAQEHPQQRVQVTRLREDALQLLIEKGYTPTGDPDGGMSKMTPEEIEGFIPI